MYTINDLLDLSKTIAAPLFEGRTYPWEVLADISDFITVLGSTLPEEEYEKRGESVWIARDAEVFPSAYIGSPCIIDHGAQVRHCAFIRASAIVGKNAVVGNSTELMGAGSITSNVKSDKSLVVIKNGDELIETGRKKVGAILGDYVEIGCNSVLNPGTVLGRRVSVYPTSCVRGVIPEDGIYKSKDDIVIRR